MMMHRHVVRVVCRVKIHKIRLKLVAMETVETVISTLASVYVEHCYLSHPETTSVLFLRISHTR